MPPYDPDDNGAGDVAGDTPEEDAWILPEEDQQPPLAPPRGVVYGDQTAPPRSDPYRPLRAPNAPESTESWPMDDPAHPYGSASRSRFAPFLVGLLVGIGLAVISIVGFQLLSGGDDEPQAATTTVAGSSTTAVESTEPTAATSPEATGVDDGSLSDPGSDPTGGSAIAAPPDEIPPVGAPLAIGDLLLSTDGIGPVTIGLPADQALGRLVSSLGAPDNDTGTVEATGEYGACPGEPVRVVHWGPLAALVTGLTGSETISAFRLDLAYGGLDSRTAALATLSGLRAGDTIEDLESTYVDFTIEYPETDAGLTFELHRRDDGALLLWGPVTSTEADGLITGIYSPDACKG